jgi:glycosyltransferase involved in cell wall biosynthesis
MIELQTGNMLEVKGPEKTAPSKKVLIITSGQPAVNPRLVKEADMLSENGWEVIVLYQYWNAWGSSMDAALLPKKKWKAIRVGGNPVSEKLKYNLSRLQHKFFKILFHRLYLKFASRYAIARSSRYLIREAKKIKADLYIGHNMGALPAVVHAAINNGGCCGFDAEDFHRFENSNNPSSPDVRIKKTLEEKYFPRLDYLTTASPLITDQYKALFPQLKINTVLNVFPKFQGRPDFKKGSRSLRLFWFSQTIGTGRGLEEVLEAIQMNNSIEIELHLLGQVDAETRTRFSSVIETSATKRSKVFFYDPLPSEKIIEFAARFDVGLATETGVPINRDICLTNKIFSYIQSGLAVVASDTLAQKQLFMNHDGFGCLYKKGNANQLNSIFESYYNDPSLLDMHRRKAWELGQRDFNWENESVHLLSIISETIAEKNISINLIK